MLLNCTENEGNKLAIEEDCNGQIIVQIVSKEMMCELVVVLSEEDTAKIKAL